MDIGDLLSRDGIVLRGGATSKRQALYLVAAAASDALGVPEAQVLDAMLEREALGSTGLGGGVAVPHARIDGLSRVCGIFVRLTTPVSFDALDDRPVDLIFALFAPPRDGAEHLRALAAVSRALRSPELREQIRQSRTVDSVHALFVNNAPAHAA